MTLSRRYFRSIKNNLSFYISATALTILSLFLFFVFNIAGSAIWEFGDEFFKTQKLEDANFTTYLPISSKELEGLEKKYDIELEIQYYDNIDTEGITTRVFKKTKEIDLYAVTEGRDAEKNDEIIISEGYGVANDIVTGDKITVGKKEYTVTGFFQRPDYLYMLQNDDDSYKNATTFYLAYVTDEEYDEIGGGNCQYLVRYGNGNEKEFRKEVNEKYYMRTYLASSGNTRVTMVKMQAEMFTEASYVILVVMPLIVVALVSIVITRKVKSEQKLIGTLTALGYKKKRLMLHYAGFAMIPGLLGGILATLFSTVFAQKIGEVGLADYEPMRISCHINPYAAMLSIFIPTAMYMLAAMLSVNRLLKKDTVNLLNNNFDRGKKDYRKILAKKRISFHTKYAMRSLIGNPARTFVVFLGIFLGSYIALLGYGFMDTADNTKNSMIDNLGSYEYQYVLNELIEDNPYMNFYDLEKKPVCLSDGYYVTSVMSLTEGISQGDTLKCKNPMTMEEFEITIEGIIDNDMQSAIFGSKENVAALTGFDENTGNVIMSDVMLQIPAKKLLKTVKKSDLGEQVQNMSSQMNVMIYFLIGTGAVICMASIYVAVNMLVAEKRSNISMLKVLGYGNRKINQIVLNVNHILLPIGFLLSIPLVFASTNWFMKIMAEFIGILPKVYVAPKSYAYTLALVCLGYFGSLFLLRRKVFKVNMVESLKDGRE